MSFYSLLKIQKHFSYISITAELFNIAYFISLVTDFAMPESFAIVLSLLNIIYLMYIVFVVMFIRGEFQNIGITIMLIFLAKTVFWETNPIMNIIDSAVCLVVLVVAHIPIYNVLDNAEKEFENQIEIKK